MVFSSLKRYRITVFIALLAAISPSILFLNTQFCSPHHETIFVHGLGGNKTNSLYYKDRLPIPNNVSSFDFYDVKDITLSQVAGPKDVNQLREYIKKESDGNCEIELMGVSRGATTALYYVATAPKNEKKNISCVIAESPFARYSDLIYNIPLHWRKHQQQRSFLYCLSYIIQGLVAPLPEKAADHLIKLTYPECDPNHNLLHVIHKISPFMPILLICSEEDSLIPAASTIKLYTQLKKVNHPRVHLFVAKQGKHVRIISGPDGDDYRLVVNAFHKQYNLPCYDYADKNEEERANQLFAQTQPSLEKLTL